MNTNAQDDQKSDDCTCITCGIRRALQAKFPGGLDDAARTEIRKHFAGITGVLLADLSPEERESYNREVEGHIQRVEFDRKMEGIFGSTGVMVIIA